MLGLGGLCLVAWMTDYSMILMLKSGAIANTNSYQDLMAAAYGRVGFAILTIIQFVFPCVGECCFWAQSTSSRNQTEGLDLSAPPCKFHIPISAMISYNVIVGDTFSTVLIRIFGNSSEDSAFAFLSSREFVIVAATVCVSLPLSLYK